MNEEVEENMKTTATQKRGRKPKDYKKEYVLNKEQTKFFVDLSNDKESLHLIQKLLVSANTKDKGQDVAFKDLAIFGIAKINEKDIIKLKENSLTKQQKLEKAWEESNERLKQNMSFEDFLLKKVIG